jgi:hypothetical protein
MRAGNATRALRFPRTCRGAILTPVVVSPGPRPALKQKAAAGGLVGISSGAAFSRAEQLPRRGEDLMGSSMPILPSYCATNTSISATSPQRLRNERVDVGKRHVEMALNIIRAGLHDRILRTAS